MLKRSFVSLFDTGLSHRGFSIFNLLYHCRLKRQLKLSVEVEKRRTIYKSVLKSLLMIEQELQNKKGLTIAAAMSQSSAPSLLTITTLVYKRRQMMIKAKVVQKKVLTTSAWFLSTIAIFPRYHILKTRGRLRPRRQKI